MNIEYFIENYVKEDQKYYYLPVNTINIQLNKEEIKKFLTENNWKYISNAKSKNNEIKNKRCYRKSKSEIYLKTPQNHGFLIEKHQTVNLQDDKNINENAENSTFFDEFLNYDLLDDEVF